MIVRGPGIKAGSVFEGNVVNYDFLPTFVDWAGGAHTDLKNIDGVSLASYMAGEQPTEAFLKRNLFPLPTLPDDYAAFRRRFW